MIQNVWCRSKRAVLTPGRSMKHPFLRGYRVLLAVCVSIVLLLPTVVDRPSYETYLSATQWETDGGFVASGKPNRRTANRRDFTHFPITRRPVLDKLYVAERSGGGATAIRPFVLRTNRVIIPVVGFPNSEDTGIYLESETNHQRFWVRVGAARLEWQPFTVSLPKFQSLQQNCNGWLPAVDFAAFQPHGRVAA